MQHRELYSISYNKIFPPTVENNLVKETMLFSKEDVEDAEPSHIQRIEIVEGLKKIREVWHKDGWNIEMTTCAEDIDLEAYGMEHNRCIDGELMKRICLTQLKPQFL